MHGWLSRVHAVFGAEPDMVGRALVSEMGLGWERIVNGEPSFVRKQPPQRTCGLRTFQTAMQIGQQIGGGEMDPAIGGVGARGDRGGVRGPHRRG